MEEELGQQLFIRSNLVKKAQNEIALSDETASGDIYIGAGETDGVRFLARAAQELQAVHPLIHIHIISGDRVSVMEQLDRGLIDFGLIFGAIDTGKYEYLKVPFTDTFGVLMRREDPLSRQETIAPADLWEKPLIVSRQGLLDSSLETLLHCGKEKLNIVASYNLLFNGSLMVEEGMGYAICLDKIINVSGNSSLCFRPLSVSSSMEMHVVWKKYSVFTKAAEKFLLKIQEMAPAL